MSGTIRKGRVEPTYSTNTSKNAKQGSAIRIMDPVDGAVNNYRQFVLCTTGRSFQVKAWLPGVRTARVSLRPFIEGFELRAGVGEWFPPFATRDGGVAAWCDGRTQPDEPVVDLSRAANGIRWVDQREEARA